MSRALSLCLLLLGGCGPRALDLALSLDVGCTLQIPAGGSLLYEIAVEGVDGGAPPRVCGACIAVAAPVTTFDALRTLLKAQAPSCELAPAAVARLRLTSFAGPGCVPASAGLTTQRLCGESVTLRAGDGRSDETVKAALSCTKGCDDVSCMPVLCAAQGKNCGSVSNGCGQTIDCGTCSPPERCGGGGTPNVCAK